MKTYTDKNIVCPFYTREEPSNVARKIHCEGYKKGNHIHMCFDTIELKKAHKNDFCKNSKGYTKCPLYPVILKRYEEDS